MVSFSYLVVCCCLALANGGILVAKSRTARVINGEDAAIGEFSYQATYLLDNYHACGAIIIANGWALTSAHCVDGQNMSSMAVVTDMTDFDNPTGYQWFDIDQVIPHESYGTGDGAAPNDVALLRLRLEDRDTSSNAVTLASGSDTFEGQTCTITGWGYTETGSASALLQKAAVTVLTEAQCIEHWGTSRISSAHICLLGTDTPEGTGACNGDTGGPLVCGGLLAGVMSFGTSGCHTDGVVSVPTVGARVSSYYSWISTNCEQCV